MSSTLGSMKQAANGIKDASAKMEDSLKDVNTSVAVMACSLAIIAGVAVLALVAYLVKK